jgi:hypothetical protein
VGFVTIEVVWAIPVFWKGVEEAHVMLLVSEYHITFTSNIQKVKNALLNAVKEVIG